jgi:hypothetical protein
MSTDFYMVCHECKVLLHVANENAGGSACLMNWDDEEWNGQYIARFMMDHGWCSTFREGTIKLLAENEAESYMFGSGYKELHP